MSEFHDRVSSAIAGVLEPGESLEGVVAATQRKAFSGRMVAVAVTDRRLVVQPLTRRLVPDGDPLSITPDAVRKASAVVSGDEWWNTHIPLTDAALTVRLKTDDGKLTLDLMRGGDGLLGRLGGGDAQEAGVAAFAAWMQRASSGSADA